MTLNYIIIIDMKLILLSIILLLVTNSLYTEDFKQLHNAIQKLDNNEYISFESKTIITSKDKISKSVVYYDPEKEPRYTLISKDDHKPSPKDINNYNKQRKKANKFSASDYLGTEFIIEHQDVNVIVYKFITKKNIIPFVSTKMPGRLWLDLKSEYILRIEIFNDNRKRLFPGIYLDSFKMSMMFIPFSEKITLIDKMEIFINAKIFTNSLNQRIESRFINYNKVYIKN